jgi:hypothetical protein
MITKVAKNTIVGDTLRALTGSGTVLTATKKNI